MIAKLKRDIAALKAEVARLKPLSGPGLRTSRTTRGTVRVGTGPAAEVGKKQDSNSIPYWQ